MRALVVDDEVELAAALARGLEAERWAVDVAHDGLDGLWRATELPYDVVVLDLVMPGLNGYEVCRTLRERGVWTPVLILTVKDGEHDEAEALDTGADDFLTKPFSFIVLLARLRALVRRGAAERPPQLEVGDLRLDPSSRRCRRGDVDIALTPTEFSLLEVLMRQAGRAVPKQELLDRVWGFDYDGGPAVVEVYASYLRSKIDRPFQRHTLRTVRGAGYLLADD